MERVLMSSLKSKENIASGEPPLQKTRGEHKRFKTTSIERYFGMRGE